VGFENDVGGKDLGDGDECDLGAASPGALAGGVDAFFDEGEVIGDHHYS
jgi:hypothetical protein